MAGEHFVDVAYRGLEVGKHVRISPFGPGVAYVEHTAPMPVGTELAVTGEDGGRVAVRVVRVHEQVGKADRPAGMQVAALAVDEAARPWWDELVSGAEPAGEAGTGAGMHDSEHEEPSAEDAEETQEAGGDEPGEDGDPGAGGELAADAATDEAADAATDEATDEDGAEPEPGDPDAGASEGAGERAAAEPQGRAETETGGSGKKRRRRRRKNRG